MILAIATAAALLATVIAGGAARGDTSLLVSQSTAFAALGHSCGGIQEQALATGFDPVSGYPTGNVYVQTRCGGSGRGGGYHTTTYSAWIGVTWDYTGVAVSSTVLSIAPVVDPTLAAFDGVGNEVYNQLDAVNVTPDSCTVGNTTYCSYRAYLKLAPTFTPPPRVTAVSVTAGPASGGTMVTITGTGFTGATAVSFGATPAASFTVSADTSITAVSPMASAGTIDITVSSGGGTSATSSADQFTFVAFPTVSGINPNSGPVSGGTLVTITGTNFVGVTGVSFGDTPAGFSVNDSMSITATAPPVEAPDSVDVIVTTVGGTSPLSAADVFDYTMSAATGTCGDGVVDPGEQCDDGTVNGQPGDCCSATCTFQPLGTACADDGSLCTFDQCDGNGACAHTIAPSDGCTPPDVAMGASLTMRVPRSGGNRAQFYWGKGPVVPLADFGDPSAGEPVQLCVYAPVGLGQYALLLSGSPSVNGGGAWTATANGWRFSRRDGAPDGITGVTLKAADVPLKAWMRVKAKNAAAFPSLPLPADAGVVAQLKSAAGTCWGATFSSPTINTPTEFKASSD